ncbi:MAG: hypothetical protein HZB16_18265 [Armatimonadetes bacterium]|nr:hypothetical protein [Armatimonadota bacterium]
MPPVYLLLGLLATAEQAPLDRHAIVSRHAMAGGASTVWPVGNGEFCVGLDGTGLQTLAGNTMAHWGWHSFALPAGITPDQVPATGTLAKGRPTGPDHFPPGQDALRAWLFDNPHRLNLGRLRLSRADGRAVTAGQLTEASRRLDLWTGIHTAEYRVDGRPVIVETAVHGQQDAVAVRISSPLLTDGTLRVTLDFGYPTLDNTPSVGDFGRADGHVTRLIRPSASSATLSREVDASRYDVNLAWSPSATLEPTDSPHRYQVLAHSDALELTARFGLNANTAAVPTVTECLQSTTKRWADYWQSGGAIDLSGSRDERWRELERRVVLSQYQMGAQQAGSWPCAETGLLGLDPWRGQFHMEMAWWHLAHYALWGRWDRAEQALTCYQRFTPAARALAEQLGLRGLKWPKSVGPEGRSAPWSGNQALLWKQPHPMFFAELAYRAKPTRATLDLWWPVLEGTAEHMADFAQRGADGLYHLTPDMPPSEQGFTRDTVFDLAYWRFGLDLAQRWRERLGLPREPHWDEVRRGLAPLPERDGLFCHSAEWLDTYQKRNWEHPDPIGVLGMLPPIDGVDPETAHRTVNKVWTSWQWGRCWGWDFPWMAMAAARVGEPKTAVDALLADSPRNHYDERGINTGGPCPYLPGNGGLLYAVAMMAAGWDGAPARPAPGFPDDGSWTVRWEGLKPAL